MSIAQWINCEITFDVEILCFELPSLLCSVMERISPYCQSMTITFSLEIHGFNCSCVRISTSNIPTQSHPWARNPLMSKTHATDFSRGFHQRRKKNPTTLELQMNESPWWQFHRVTLIPSSDSSYTHWMRGEDVTHVHIIVYLRIQYYI